MTKQFAVIFPWGKLLFSCTQVGPAQRLMPELKTDSMSGFASQRREDKGGKIIHTPLLCQHYLITQTGSGTTSPLTGKSCHSLTKRHNSSLEWARGGLGLSPHPAITLTCECETAQWERTWAFTHRWERQLKVERQWGVFVFKHRVWTVIGRHRGRNLAAAQTDMSENTHICRVERSGEGYHVAEERERGLAATIGVQSQLASQLNGAAQRMPVIMWRP